MMRRRLVEEPAPPPTLGSVVLVHGIHSGGQWYAHAETVLRPHLVPYPVHYAGYRTIGLGLFRTVLPLEGLILGGLLASAMRHTEHGSWTWLLPIASALVLRAMLRAIPTAKVRTALGAARGMGKPRVLAHSWGTYLAWRALRSEPTRETDVLVLVGTPLAREVRWKAKRLRERVWAVHNVILKHDAVMRPLMMLTSLPVIGRIARLLVLPAGIGGAGGAPFILQHGDLVPNDNHVVEPAADAPEAWACGSCEERIGWLHNWCFSGRHEELLTRYDHLAELVRPLLWGMMPADFRRWLEDCRALAPWVRLELAMRGSAWEGLALGAAGETRSTAVARLLDTERPFWGDGATLRRELRSRLAPIGAGPQAEERWALLIAGRVCAAQAAEMRAWLQCVDKLARGVWYPGPAGELPDAEDVRFAMYPSRAVEEVCIREAQRWSWRDVA